MQRIRLNGMMARLRGRFSERDPSDGVQQALNDALHVAPTLRDEPDEDV